MVSRKAPKKPMGYAEAMASVASQQKPKPKLSKWSMLKSAADSSAKPREKSDLTSVLDRLLAAKPPSSPSPSPSPSPAPSPSPSLSSLLRGGATPTPAPTPAPANHEPKHTTAAPDISMSDLTALSAIEIMSIGLD